METTPSSFRLGPWLVAAFVVLVVFAGVVVVVVLGGQDEPTPGAVTAAVPGVPLGPADAEGQDQSFTAPLGVPDGTILPDFSSASISDAQLWLRRAGAPFVILQVFDPEPTGLVIDQLPAAGSALDSSATVTVVISRGPAPPPEEAAPEDAAPDGPDAAGPDEPSLPPDAAAPGGTPPAPPIDGTAPADAGTPP